MFFWQLVRQEKGATIKSAAKAASLQGFASRLTCIHRFGVPSDRNYMYVFNCVGGLLQNGEGVIGANSSCFGILMWRNQTLFFLYSLVAIWVHGTCYLGHFEVLISDV